MRCGCAYFILDMSVCANRFFVVYPAVTVCVCGLCVVCLCVARARGAEGDGATRAERGGVVDEN